MSLSKNINPSLVLVQPKKTRPFVTERLFMGRKESNKQTKYDLNHLTQYSNPDEGTIKLTCTVMPTKSDSDVIFCLQLLKLHTL